MAKAKSCPAPSAVKAEEVLSLVHEVLQLAETGARNSAEAVKECNDTIEHRRRKAALRPKRGLSPDEQAVLVAAESLKAIVSGRGTNETLH